MKKRSRYSVKLLLFAIGYIALMIITVAGSMLLYDRGVMFFGIELATNSVLGCITTIQILLCVAMTSIDWKAGSKQAIILMSVSAISLLLSIVKGKHYESIPGGFMLACGIIFIMILRSRMKVIDANNRFYQQISITDSLTGLVNRRGCRSFITDLIATNTPFYLLFIDLDNFKYVNDTIGHYAGDIILKTVAQNCGNVGNPEGLFARNGGDEFVVVVKETPGLDIKSKVQEYLDAIHREVFLKDANIHYLISGCIGVSHFPEHATELDAIMNYADTAMYEAKKDGYNNARFFAPKMVENTLHDKMIEDMVTEGLKEKNFYLVYQPQFETKSHRLRGFECLLRLNDAQGNPVSPREFIPVAEKSDLILEIDWFVLREAMEHFVKIVQHAKRPFLLAVNISAKHISRRQFVNGVKNLLCETGFPASCLEIEITEYCMVRNTEAAAHVLNELSRLGIKIAIDDFGTGYASLSNLTRLPIDLLKIDKSFVDNLAVAGANHGFVDAIISMGHLVNCDIISEGVETEEQLKILEEGGCDYIQGYLWGKPMPYEQALSLIENENNGG